MRAIFLFSVGLFLVVFDNAVNSQKFNKQYIGVAFSPYTDKNPKRGRNGYSLKDITTKLNKVSSKFKHISTYGMGANTSPECQKSWDKCDSSALIARAAANINKQKPNSLSVNIGTWQAPGNLRQVEINNAIKAAKDANKIKPGTVWGITITNEHVTSPQTGNEVLTLVKQTKAKNPGVKVGTRIHTCEQISGGELKDVLTKLAKACDFIYCNMYAGYGAQNPSEAAKEVGGRFNKAKNAFKNINKNLGHRIGETGWPSAGTSFNQTPNNPKNLVAYSWNAMNTWAHNNGVQVQMFSAIDEPWKGDENAQGFTAESFYGWWNKPDNNNDRLVAKG